MEVTVVQPLSKEILEEVVVVETSFISIFLSFRRTVKKNAQNTAQCT